MSGARRSFVGLRGGRVRGPVCGGGLGLWLGLGLGWWLRWRLCAGLARWRRGRGALGGRREVEELARHRGARGPPGRTRRAATRARTRTSSSCCRARAARARCPGTRRRCARRSPTSTRGTRRWARDASRTALTHESNSQRTCREKNTLICQCADSLLTPRP